MTREQRTRILLSLTLVLATATLADEAYIPPSVTGYLEELDDGTPSYSRFTGMMRYGRFSSPPGVGTDHAFLKFSLDSLPDSIVVLSATLAYDQYEHAGRLPAIDVRLTHDLTTVSPHDAFLQIAIAAIVGPGGASADGWDLWTLDSSAMPLLDSCRRVGVTCFAIHWSGSPADTCRASAYGYDSSAVPYLHIVYRSSGILETPRVAAALPLLSFAPNPTRSAFVMVNHTAAIKATLTLRDVLGETVRSFSLAPSGRTRLDLRGLSPSVYMATFEGTGPPVSRKLVIAAR